MAEELEKILEIQNLKTSFNTELGIVKAVDDVSFELYKGETLGLVGESGCGKSVTALSTLRLLQTAQTSGRITFENQNILELNDEEMRKIRGNKISMIFQDPLTSLNPVFTIGEQIMEAIRLHQGVNKREAKQIAIEMLAKTSIPDPEKRVNEYPHQLSGGMCQRALIAMALSCNPQILIADEPTTALDVTVQAQILELMNDLKRTIDSSIILITHDLGVIAEVADRVAVMYAGKIVEYSDKKKIFKETKHPYTAGLLKSLPRKGQEKLEPIMGSVPNLLDMPSGCTFHPRCEYQSEVCTQQMPQLTGEEGHKVRCLMYG